MTDPVPPATPVPPAAEEPWLRICSSDQLEEKGDAIVFDVMQYRSRVRAFAMRFDGKVVAYLNRCVHVPVELDWQPGQFLDSRKEYILCSIHGAAYNPGTGRCVAGPCGRGGLAVLQVREVDGDVLWQPTRDIRPAEPDPA
ncbi:Rieske 2Fe-2S domain-containing protein [soil metagenome]